MSKGDHRPGDLPPAWKVRELFHYDPATGIFTRKVRTSNRVKVNEVAGLRKPSRYVLICVDGRQYRAHRLAWLYVHGEPPNGDLDHINRIKTDNRIANLREATRKQNMENTGAQKNSATGVKGVHWDAVREKWASTIHHHGKTIAGGRFDSIDQATRSRKALEKKYFAPL